MKVQAIRGTQVENDGQALFALVIVAAMMLSAVVVLGGVAVARAHEGELLRATIASVPAWFLLGACLRALVRSSGDRESTFKIAGFGLLAWFLGAAIQTAGILFAPSIASAAACF